MNTHLAQITRGAARALGHAAASWEWDDEQCALVGTVGLHNQPHSFSPLRDPADTFTLEALLRLDVTYEASDKHTQIAVRCPARSGQMTYMALLPARPQASRAMAERMRAVTQFAALLDQLDIADPT